MTCPLFGAESDELSAHVKRKGVEMLGGKKSEAYKDKRCARWYTVTFTAS